MRQLPLRRRLSHLRRTVSSRGMIADHYLQLRTDLETALIRLLRLGADLHRSPGSLETLHALLIDIRQPLLFVVVGEVKAGKSSLLNALFGREFPKTGGLPATDRGCIFRSGGVEKTVHRHLQDTALPRLGAASPIFAVSARQALLARTGAPGPASLEEKSQIVPLQEHIDLIMSDASAHALKLRSAWQTAQVVLEEIASEVREAFRTIKQDEERFDRLTHFLQTRKEQTLRQVHGFVRGIEQACRDCAVQGTRFLESKLTFWTTVNMIWRRDYWQRDFQGEMETKLRQFVQPQIENAVQLLETDLRGIWPQLQDMIDTYFGGGAKSQAPRTPPDFARQRRELLQSIQLTLAERSGGNAIEEQTGEI